MNSLIKPVRRLTIALLSLSLLSSLAPVANAATFTRVLQTGQNVPGNSQPVNGIRSVAIDNQKNIVAVISTLELTLPGPPMGDGGYQIFQGLYLFDSALVPTLVDTANSFSSRSSGTQSANFITASLNAGTAIALRYSQYQSRTYMDFGKTQVRVGTPGSVQTFLTANQLNTLPRIGNTLALNNGAALLLGEATPPPTASLQKGLLKSNAPGNLTEAIAVTDPVFGSEIFTPTDANQLVRSSGNNLLLVTQNVSRYRVFKKSGTNAPQQIYNGTVSPFDASSSCGAAISGNNIVLCSKEVKPTQTATNPYSLRVKFGNAAAFQTIAFPNNVPIEQPSIAGRTVIFKTATPTLHKLYVSTNAQAPVQILATGDTLDGKIVSKLTLSEQGQSIARTTVTPVSNLMAKKPDLGEQDQVQNFSLTIVFIATFTDGSTGLYRGTL